MGRLAQPNSEPNISIEDVYMVTTGDKSDFNENPDKFMVELDESTYIEEDIPTNNDVEYFDLY